MYGNMSMYEVFFVHDKSIIDFPKGFYINVLKSMHDFMAKSRALDLRLIFTVKSVVTITSRSMHNECVYLSGRFTGTNL